MTGRVYSLWRYYAQTLGAAYVSLRHRHDRCDCRYHNFLEFTEINSISERNCSFENIGCSKKSIMPGYVIAPLVIGAVGCLVDVARIYLGAPGMLSFYEEMIGLPIRLETDFHLYSK